MEKESFIKCGEKLKDTLELFTGEEGAHFAFIADKDGHLFVCCGGRADMVAMGTSTTLVTYIQNTPFVGENFADMIAATVRGVLEATEGQTQ